MKPSRESPLFVKTYDLVLWLLRHTRKFPKDQRFVLGQRMEQAAFDLQDALLAAVRTDPKRLLGALHQADRHLDRLRVYARLSYDLGLSSSGQYEHLATGLDELGRLLGGWMGVTSGRRPRQAERGACEAESPAP